MSEEVGDNLAIAGCCLAPLILFLLFAWGCAVFGTGMMLGLIFILVAGIGLGVLLIMASGGGL